MALAGESQQRLVVQCDWNLYFLAEQKGNLMRIGTVSSLQIGKYGRMDAEFNLLVQEFEGRAGELEERFSIEQIADLLNALELEDIKVLAPLMRGDMLSKREAQRTVLLKAAAEYPHLALAVIEPHLAAGIRRRVDDQIVSANRLAATLDEWNVQLQIGAGLTSKF